MDKKIRDILFFCICFSLIFITIPKPIQMNLIGGPLSNKLVFYPVIVGIVYSIYCQYKYKNVFVYINILKYFTVVYTIIVVLSLVIGLYKYPYYDLVVNGPINQIGRLPSIISFLEYIGLNFEEKFLLLIMMVLRIIKIIFFEYMYTFFAAYMIYCWYHNDWQKGINILFKGIISSLMIIFLYSIIEIFYLAGNDIAKNILIEITPYFHAVVINFDWWPPLLWENQLRSIFAEPSFLGIYGAFLMPLLWYKLFIEKKHKLIYSTTVIAFTTCVFLTQARTAVVLFCGEIIILTIFALYKNKIISLKKISLVWIYSIIAFCIANIFISSIMVNINKKDVEDKSKETFVETYFENNVNSLTTVEKRSNRARYSIMISNFNIGKDNFILGVGPHLRNAYILDYLPDISKSSREVNMWINNQEKYGVLKTELPNLGEYLTRFAEMGMLGLIIFLVAPFILLKELLKKIINEKNVNNEYFYVCYITSLIGVLATGLGDSINTTYCYWILLGLGYSICFGMKKNI